MTWYLTGTCLMSLEISNMNRLGEKG